ncbi:MAG: imidazole glycerol phosphate synthase subunit HisF [Alphaproteobacteria bacterium]
MSKRRLIATLLINNGVVVQTRRFKRTNMVGNAFTAVDFFNTWTVDEIAILEISNTRDHLAKFEGIVEELSRRCFVPLAVGGKIDSVGAAARYTRLGADKVVVNTHAVERPDLIEAIAADFGSQCVVLSIDALRDDAHPSGYQVMVDNARRGSGRDVLDWAREGVARGAGEVLVNAVEHDGDKRGYDLKLVRMLADALAVPVVAMGGVGEWQHLVDGVVDGHADAVAAGNIFHYTEHSTKKAKEFMAGAGLNVRASQFYRIAMPRRPKYAAY